MKKLFSCLVIVMFCIAPLQVERAWAQSSLYQFETPELNPPELEFPDLEFGNENPSPDDGSDEEITVPEECTIPLSDLLTVQNFPPEDGPIIAFGDSLTSGVGATNGQDYVSELERLANVNIVNEGISGNTTEDALARLQRDVLSQNPSTVIVWLGGNDILNRYYQRLDEENSDTIIGRLLDAIFEFFGKDPNREEIITEAETFENIEEIIERIQATGALVVLVGMDGEPLDNNLGGRYEALAEANDVIFIPDVLDNILGRPSLTSDPVHPNNAGYDIVARRINAGFACTQVSTEVPDDDDDSGEDDEEEEEEDNDPEPPPPSSGGSTRVCVDTDNDGYKECTYVRNGDTNTDDDSEEEEEDTDEPETPPSRGDVRRVCVDTDNDGYKECTYERQ